MGTSSPFGGGKGKDPLIPSWVGGGGDNPPPPPLSPPTPPGSPPTGQGQNPGPSTSAPSQPPPNNPVFSPIEQRFRGPRTNFNQYARSNGDNTKSLARAISSYVSRASGGSKTAARRMASDRRVARQLGGILTQAGQSGIREVVRTLNLAGLTDRSIAEIYASLVDVICEPGGDLDEAYPRDAYLEAVAEIIEMDVEDLEQPSPDTISLIMERFIANTIHNRILNAIGSGLISLPDSVASVQAIDQSFRQFVRGAVSDALNEIGRVFNSSQMKAVIDGIFERSLAILQVHADANAGGAT
jgi:hypothetical protein